MNILCVIDSFGSGGAQRQLVNLACGLKARGHSVSFFAYYPRQDFFRAELEAAGVSIYSTEKKGRIGCNVLASLSQLVFTNEFDVLVSFLDTPNVYSVAASIFSPNTKLIVSERSSYHHDKNRFVALCRRALYFFADHVVANSKTQALWLSRYAWLKTKTITIYNGFPLDSVGTATPERSTGDFIVIGRVGPEKNGIRLVEALEIFRNRHGYVPTVSWVGKEDVLPAGQDYVRRLKVLLEKHPEVKAKWRWFGERRDVFDLLKAHRALIHPSLYEGLPNVVCESFLAGRPVLASNVCDHPYLLENGRRGFLFDPLSPASIADSIEKALNLSDEQWWRMSDEARAYAESHLGIDRMVSEYEQILR